MNLMYPLLAGAGVLVAVKMLGGKKSVTGKSGKPWRVEMISPQGASPRIYEVFSPKGTFGPHDELSVLRYSQTGDAITARAFVGYGAGVPRVMIETAASDFGVPLTGVQLPA